LQTTKHDHNGRGMVHEGMDICDVGAILIARENKKYILYTLKNVYTFLTNIKMCYVGGMPISTRINRKEIQCQKQI